MAILLAALGAAILSQILFDLRTHRMFMLDKYESTIRELLLHRNDIKYVVAFIMTLDDSVKPDEVEKYHNMIAMEGDKILDRIIMINLISTYDKTCNAACSEFTNDFSVLYNKTATILRLLKNYNGEPFEDTLKEYSQANIKYNISRNNLQSLLAHQIMHTTKTPFHRICSWVCSRIKWQ